MVICKHCESDSVVKESRTYAYGEVTTKLRIRQCKHCRWRWKTIEIEMQQESK